MSDKIHRRNYLKSIGAAGIYIPISTVAESKKPDETGIPLAVEKVPDDIGVYNNDTKSHTVMVELTDANKSAADPVFSKRFQLPGLNDNSRDKSQATSKRQKLNIPTGRQYTVSVELESKSLTYDWYVPKDSLDLVSLTVSVRPGTEVKISDGIS